MYLDWITSFLPPSLPADIFDMFRALGFAVFRLWTEIMLSGCRRFVGLLSNANIEFARFKEQMLSARNTDQYRCPRADIQSAPNIQFPGGSARKKWGGEQGNA